MVVMEHNLVNTCRFDKLIKNRYFESNGYNLEEQIN